MDGTTSPVTPEQLKKSPLVEALCELRFEPSAAWDMTVPGRLFDLIKGEFGERAQVHGFGLQVNLGQAKPAAAFVAAPELLQLKRPDRTAIVQIGPNLLSVNQLPPYPSWSTFRALILRILGECLKVVGTPRLARAGLRYINQLPVAEADRFEDAITVMPTRREALDKPLRGFYQRYELELAQPLGLLVHQTGLLRTPDGDRLMLDLDVGSEGGCPDATNPADMGRWLDAAHEQIEGAFLATLTKAQYERLRTGT